MSKHTPGPWKVEGTVFSANPSRVLYSVHNEGDVIADINTEADAHLIAAAPDMYEALKGTLAAINGALVLFDMPDLIRENYLVIVGEADAAIAKAEGR